MSTKLETEESRIGTMNAVETVVCERFETGDDTLKEIAADLSLPEVQVVAILSKFSPQFRDHLPVEGEGNGEVLIRDSVIVANQGEFDKLRNHAHDLAISAESEAVQWSATRYLLDEVKGRNDQKEDNGRTQLNVQFQIIAARKENTEKLIKQQLAITTG